MSTIGMTISRFIDADPTIPFTAFNNYLNETLGIENPLLKRVVKVAIFAGAGIAGSICLVIWTIMELILLPILLIKAQYHWLKYRNSEDAEMKRIQAEKLEFAKIGIGTVIIQLIPIYGWLCIASTIIDHDQMQ